MIEAGMNFILIEIDEPEKTSGLIFIPQVAQHKGDKGKVILFGSEVKNLLPGLSKDSFVYCVKGASTKTPMIIEGKNYFNVQSSDVLCYTSVN